MQTLLIWLGFLVFVGVLIALDLGVFHRKSHTISMREALTWTVIWIATAMFFNAAVYFLYDSGMLQGRDLDGRPLTAANAALQFLTGYLLEYSLSVDNIFVIAVIIATFRVPPGEQHRVLFWGVMGAVVLRGVMILGGTALIDRFQWMMYVFGGLLIVSAVKMFTADDGEIDVEKSLLVRAVRKFYPVTTSYHGSRFFVELDGRRHVTPLLLTIVLVEGTDVMFALDSIPAVIGITREPFLVFTSNIFAILGLRSLYFALAGLMDKFRYLKAALVFLLAFIGVKMLLQAAGMHVISTPASLAVIVGILSVGVAASLIASHREERAERRKALEAEAGQAPAIGVGASPDLET